MITLNIKLNNRTEYAVFETLWAANIRARDILAANPQVNAVEIVDENGVLQAAYRRG